MKKYFPAIMLTLMLSVAAPIYAADTTLACDGVSRVYGHNAPKRVHFEADYPSSGDLLVLDSDRKWVAGLLLNTDTKLTLCKETSTELLYSFDCGANWRDYVSDWTSNSNQKVASKLMTKKYGQHWSDFESITLNRINLTVKAEYLTAEVARDFTKLKSNKNATPADITEALYVRVTEYTGSCKLKKARL